MDTMSTMMGTGGSNLGLIGTGIKTGATIGGGLAAKQAADFEAAQYRQRAPMELAAAQRTGFERADAGARVAGQAKAAAAGSGAMGESSNLTIAEIMNKAKYQQEAELYKGRVAANNDLNAAAAATLRGKNLFKGSILEGVATGLQGAASYATKMFPPKTPTAATDNTGDTSLLDDPDSPRARQRAYSYQ